MRCGAAGVGGIPTRGLRFIRRRITIVLSAGRCVASGRVFSAHCRAAKTRRTACSSTVPASRSIAAPVAEKGGLGSWSRPDEGRTQHQAARRLRSERAACRPSLDAGQPRRSFRRARIASANTHMTEKSTSRAISSNAYVAASRTGGASQPGLIEISKTSWPLSHWPQPSYGGCNKSGP